jgi:hypothetical protein
MKEFDARSSFRLHPSSLNLGGCSSVGRASAFQAEGREFESRRPLQERQIVSLSVLRCERTQVTRLALHSPRSSGVERLLGKEEVMSSNLIAGSRVYVA